LDKSLGKDGKIEPKLFAWLAILIAAWLIFMALAPPEFAPNAAGENGLGEKSTVVFKAITGTQTILDKSIEVEKGTNAFEAMQTVAEVQFQDFGEMGVMVEAINGVSPGENEFWGLYLDGELAPMGISAISIEKDTAIEWKIETIEAYG